MIEANEVLRFWLEEVGPDGWYREDEAVDDRCRDLFIEAWELAQEGGLGKWLTWPRGALAYVLLLDQFPRNMFRGEARAFATDASALAAAKKGISLDWDMQIPEPERQFFYLPLMHSETLSDQERAVRLFLLRMPETGSGNLDHARAHREVIRRFGRFPYRNAALTRRTTDGERAFLDAGGYGAVLRELSETEAA